MASPPLVLKRADIGFGRLIVDDRGITRERLVRTSFLAWDEIRDYRLTIEYRGAGVEVLYLVDWLNLALIGRDIVRGARGEHRLRLGLEVIGDSERVFFNWRYRGVAMAIARVLQRVAGPLSEALQRTAGPSGIVRSGPLTLSEHGVQWKSKEPLAQGSVESIELFDSSPVKLRVMARGKAWPYAQAMLADIPNLIGVLDVAERRGYRVKGRGLIARFTDQG